jgi:hypothetical protein
MTRIGRLQLPRPSVAWTVPPDLAPHEMRWPCFARVPGSKRDLPGGGWVCSIKCIGWVRGPAIEPSAWERRQAERLAEFEAKYGRSRDHLRRP